MSRIRPEKIQALKIYLEREAKRLEAINQIASDAIAPALEFKTKADQEVAAFICSCFAYGNVKQIQKSVRLILSNFRSPYFELAQSTDRDIRSVSKGWKHRFNDENDLYVLLKGLQNLAQKVCTFETKNARVGLCRPGSSRTNSLIKIEDEKLFASSSDGSAHAGKMGLPIFSHLKGSLDNSADFWAEELSSYFQRLAVELVHNKDVMIDWRSFRFMLPQPSRGSTCKRLYLFFRWCVGDNQNDLNLWGTKFKRNLIMPIDTHTFEFARRFKLTHRKTPNHKTALEVTDFFKRLDPNDPIRFDFAVCHLGIRGEMPRGWQEVKNYERD